MDNKLTISGFLKNESSFNIGHAKGVMKIEDMVQIETEYAFSDSISFFSVLRQYYDSAFDANSLYRINRRLLSHARGNYWLREVYLDYNSPSFDMRIGRQQVVWGTADGIKIMDVVCPTDQREYYLDTFSDSRIPRWMLKLEYSPRVNGTLQFLFIPDFETDFIPPPGSPFTYYATTQKGALFESIDRLSHIPRTHYTIQEAYHRPGQSFENSSFGVRWLDVLSNGLEYSLNYLHGYGTPGSRVIIYNPGRPPFPGAPPQGDWVYDTKYHFVELFGFTFTKGIPAGPLQGLTIRGEFAYIHNNYNPTRTPNRLGGIASVDNYKYVLGLDKYLITNWLFSFQFIQLLTDRVWDDGNRLLFGPTLAPLDKCETFLTLRTSTDFMHERIKPDCLIMYGDDNDWRVSPRVEYELRDYLNIALGGNFFWGRRDQLLGEFRDNDQGYVEIKYGF
jgi:hypothetical protein